MRTAFATAMWIAILCGPATGQPASPVFEAADVHVSAAGSTESGGFLPGGRVEFRATTLLRLIAVAYSVPPDRVAGGPVWIDTDRFDVVAKGPASAPRLALVAMLQNLLVERFELSVERGEKPLPVYALVAGKKGSAKQSASPGDPDCKRTVEDTLITYRCRNLSIAALAENLPGVAPAYFAGHPVVDRTGLAGVYDFELQWVGRGALPPGPAGLSSSLSLFTSIEKQLDVKVELQTAPVPVLTVSHANRTPVANPPGVTEKLGPAPTEFEVADVRPSRPGENPDFKMENGRINAKAVPLKDLIRFAYNLEDDALKGGEKWLESEKFDIAAKTAPTESADTLRVMLQTLLAERFGLKVHQDRQPVSVYALTAVKPKFKDADPAERTTCNLSLADGGRTYTCQNATMAQFADKIRDAAGGYLDHPVVDLTGLKGHYDFSLTWAPQRRILRAAAAAAGGGDSTAAGAGLPSPADPSGALTVFQAVDRFLGLKLAVQKLPMPVIVIDHLERKPTGN